MPETAWGCGFQHFNYDSAVEDGIEDPFLCKKKSGLLGPNEYYMNVKLISSVFFFFMHPRRFPSFHSQLYVLTGSTSCSRLSSSLSLRIMNGFMLSVNLILTFSV